LRGIARRYRRLDGVLSGEFNRHASMRRQNGELLFGGVEGITRFHPIGLTSRSDPPPLVFTRWRKVTASGFHEVLMDGVERLRLGPGDRAFSIEFAALTYSAGLSRRYRYHLEGVSHDWIESSENLVTYATPPPGRYVLRVQASAGADGEWHEPGAAVDFVVVPPFWGTLWFRGLAVVAVLSTLWALHRLRLRRALETERLRGRISRDLHDEIGAGLSSIALLSDSVATAGGLGETDRTQLQRMASSARDMVADLRDIVWAIDPDSDRFADVVTRMRDVASALLLDVNITFQVTPNSELSHNIGLAARRDLLLIFKELLHNIARHSNARNVRIELESHGPELRLLISDDGVGFSADGLRPGTGLKSLRERAARLGGHLDLTSEVGKGTTASLRLRMT
jgi:signal transduction histidine kinase